MKNFAIISLICWCASIAATPHTVYQYNPDGKNPIVIEHYTVENDLIPLEVCHIEENGKSVYFYYNPQLKQLTADIENHDLETNQRALSSYNEQGKLTKQQLYDSTGNLLFINEDSKAIDPKPDTTDSNSSIFWTLWQGICNIGESFSNRLEPVKNYLNHVKKDLAYSEYIKEDVDYALHQVFSESFLQLAGYYEDTSHIGVFNPDHEINDKVRITLINGILTIKEDLESSLDQFSKVHGGNTIHYVFHSTEGWTNDLLDSAYIKMGYVSLHARLLAGLWKHLIQEMGGPQAGGNIVHYAHSIGATDTLAAKDLLTPEEQGMIHVITLGSPTLIPNIGFASVVNYASKRDIICAIDLKTYINEWIANDGNVNFLGSYFEMPLIEHTLTSKSYSEVIEQLGKQFIKDYH